MLSPDFSDTFCTCAYAICSGGCNVVCGESKSYPSARPEESRRDLGTHASEPIRGYISRHWHCNSRTPTYFAPLPCPSVTIKSTSFVPSDQLPLSSPLSSPPLPPHPQIVVICPIMTSFFPTDAIRSRLEWNATLNPAAAPQTTEETKYQRKVRIALHLGYALPYLVARRRSSRPSVSLRMYGACPIWFLNYICTGPKVNTVEKLAELQRAGVNIGKHRLG